MSLFAFQVAKFISMNTDFSTKRCIYRGLSECPAIEYSWNVVYDKFISIISITAIGHIVGLGCMALFKSLRDWFLKHKLLSFFLFCLFLFVAIVLMVYFDIRLFFRVSYTGVYLEELISKGDWLSVYCTIDTLSECTHSHSLLIIKDVKKFGVGYLNGLFDSFKSLKTREKIPMLMGATTFRRIHYFNF